MHIYPRVIVTRAYSRNSACIYICMHTGFSELYVLYAIGEYHCSVFHGTRETEILKSASIFITAAHNATSLPLLHIYLSKSHIRNFPRGWISREFISPSFEVIFEILFIHSRKSKCLLWSFVLYRYTARKFREKES